MSRSDARPRDGDLITWGFASRAKEGHTASGDRQAVVPFSHGILVAAVDGLGHGDEAAIASETAVRVLEAEPDLSVIGLVRRCHEALMTTRGVVMSLASFNAREGTLTWIGVGNVEGVLLRADGATTPARETLLLRGGVVGYQLPQLVASVIPVSRGDVLVFATDGVRAEFTNRLAVGEPPQMLADRVLAENAKTTDDALVLVVEFKGAVA